MKLNTPMKVCKICFKDIKENSLLYLINPNLSLCKTCYNKLIPHFRTFKVDKYDGLAFYDYDEEIRALLYQLKGCFDYELALTFLDRYIQEIRLKYFGYIIVPIPSYIKDDERRGFNHVQEIFKILNLKTVNAIIKTDHFKQADNDHEKRKEISKHLQLVDGVDLSNKKVLLVDDVYSTGSTMKASIKLIEKLHPKKIKVLVMAKTNDEKYKKKED